MEFLVCGSAAAEGIPALFCQCRVCAQARLNQGKDIRSRTAYQLGQQVRIDWGADALYHAHQYQLDYSQLRHLFLTHTHDDHWYFEQFLYRGEGFAHLNDRWPLHFYAVQETLDSLPSSLTKSAGLVLHPLTMWQAVELEDQDMSVIPILANHAQDRICVNFILRVGNRWVLQGNDTGWYTDQTWDFLKSYRFDVVLFDATCGLLENARNNHMSCDVVIEAVEKLESLGCLNEGCVRIANHFSHNGLALHHELEARLAPHQITPAYDGMKIWS